MGRAGIGARAASWSPRIRSMRSSITTRRRAGGAAATFTAEQQRPRRRFGRRQVLELPSISVIVSEHRTHRLRCPACSARTTASCRTGSPDRRSGPGCRRRS